MCTNAAAAAMRWVKGKPKLTDPSQSVTSGGQAVSNCPMVRAPLADDRSCRHGTLLSLPQSDNRFVTLFWLFLSLAG